MEFETLAVRVAMR